MAHTISALQQHRQSETRRVRNHAVKSALRTQLKKVFAAIEQDDTAKSGETLKTAYRLLDRAVAKGVLHKNNASRHKSRLASRVNTVGTDKNVAAEKLKKKKKKSKKKR